MFEIQVNEASGVSPLSSSIATERKSLEVLADICHINQMKNKVVLENK